MRASEGSGLKGIVVLYHPKMVRVSDARGGALLCSSWALLKRQSSFEALPKGKKLARALKKEVGTAWKIYLGDIALPLPLNFGTPVGHRDIEARRVFEWEEIERQSQRYIIEQSWKERAAAIRARRDRERAAAQADTTGNR